MVQDCLLLLWPREPAILGDEGASHSSSSSSSSSSLPYQSARRRPYILGRHAEGGPSESIVVVIGLWFGPPKHFVSPSSHNDVVILGRCRLVESGATPKPSAPDTSGSLSSSLSSCSSSSLPNSEHSHVWIEASLSRPRPRWPWTSSCPSAFPIFHRLSIPFRSESDRQATSDSQRSTAINLVLYDPPNPDKLQFLSLEPLLLGPVSGHDLHEISRWLLDEDWLSGRRAGGREEVEEERPSTLPGRLESLIRLDPLRWEELVHGKDQRPGRGLRIAIDLANDTQSIVNRLKFRPPLPSPSSSTSSSTHRAPSSASSTTANFETPPAPKSSHRLLGHLGNLTTTPLLFARLFRTALAIPIPLTSSQTPRSENKKDEAVSRGGRGRKRKNRQLKEFSRFLEQLDHRVSQLALAPLIARRLRYLRKEELLPIKEISWIYLGLWNSIWLTANDLILGRALGAFIMEHHRILSRLLSKYLMLYTVERLEEALVWLRSWPVGLKLNSQLSNFLVEMFCGSISLFRSLFLEALLIPNLDGLVWSIGLAGSLLGLTAILTLSTDLWKLSTIHLRVLKSVSLSIYLFFLLVQSSLFDLFRGKKKNMLRSGRKDPSTYELDQLLLGTILFTLTTFLFPTILSFYLLLSSSWLLFTRSQEVIETSLTAILNHLPIFGFMLLLKDPNRLPSGIRLELHHPINNDDDRDVIKTTIIKTTNYTLRSSNLGFRQLFSESLARSDFNDLLESPLLLLDLLVGGSRVGGGGSRW